MILRFFCWIYFEFIIVYPDDWGKLIYNNFFPKLWDKSRGIDDKRNVIYFLALPQKVTKKSRAVKPSSESYATFRMFTPTRRASSNTGFTFPAF